VRSLLYYGGLKGGQCDLSLVSSRLSIRKKRSEKESGLLNLGGASFSGVLAMVKKASLRGGRGENSRSQEEAVQVLKWSIVKEPISLQRGDVILYEE